MCFNIKLTLTNEFSVIDKWSEVFKCMCSHKESSELFLFYVQRYKDTILNFSKYKSKWLIKYLLICRMKTINS